MTSAEFQMSGGKPDDTLDEPEIVQGPALGSDDDRTVTAMQRLDVKTEVNEANEAPRPTPIPQDATPPAEERKPLTLTELPVDILKDIVKEVTHTNDLTNLCLTCRCLHALTIPQIYSRFDIVWPDSPSNGERTGVDALTFGLATLVAMGPRGNNYAHWVKKFSLGNGPVDWVNEYNISKESGKMLGTLVCLAITKMKNLETFSWDMPTGVLRDVFMALHDLSGTIKNVHVRFHDNRTTLTTSSQDPSRRVEFPTFRGFKGLKTLSVLDIDERQYLEEISYALEASVGKLKELRIGLAPHLSAVRSWIRDWDDLEETSPKSFDSEEAPIGGVLGILVSKIVDLEDKSRRRRRVEAEPAPPAEVVLNAPFSPAEVGSPVEEIPPAEPQTPEPTPPPPPPPPPYEDKPTTLLKLETLDLERVPLSIYVLTKSLDWSILTSLTILNCPNHERLWQTLRRTFSPFAGGTTSPTALSTASGSMKHNNLTSHSSAHRRPHYSPTHPLSYKLHLKKIHTDCVTTHLVSFIRNTLPPNSLEVLFLQEASTPSSVTLESIYKGCIKRHRSSLRKLLIDSRRSRLPASSSQDSSRWEFTRELIAFLSSGRVPELRELAFALEYKDWHYFLTRLPGMQGLRSLFVTNVRDAPYVSDAAPRELANAVLNTVILRPECELCYVGVREKCFEILEGGGADRGGEEGAVEVVEESDDEEGEEGEEDDADAEEADDDDVLESLGSESGGEEEETEGIRLREILFYDDKVAIFRARGARL